jgi:CheY-like chemotaxis protein
MPKILLVEDDTNLREIFDMRLKAEGYQTVAASDGEEGLVVAMKERPDLIIADVMMPKLSGFEMLETLFAAPEMAGTKAVMMTALGQPEDRARGEKLGVIKYLVKSQVTLEDFVRVIREVLAPEPASTGSETGLPGSTNSSSTVNNKESEVSMPDDTSTPQPSQPTNDAGTDNSNPISGAPAGAGSDQPTTEQEQSTVQDQINTFVSTPPATDAPADGGMGATEPASTPDAGAGTDASPQPDIPMTSPPADPAGETPEAPAEGTPTPPAGTL